MEVKKYRLKYSVEDIVSVQNDVAALLKTGYLTDGGKNVKEFEDMWGAFNNSKYNESNSNFWTYFI